MASIDYSGVVGAVAEGKRVLDVRTREEFLAGRIPGSVNVPLAEMDDAMSLSSDAFATKYGGEKPVKDAGVVVSCKMGGRAARAGDKLGLMGFEKILVYSGSFLDWEKNGGAIEK